MDKRSAIAAINKRGALLVFPIKDKPEVPSLWSHFYPRTRMKWEWDENGDDRVADLWHLRAQLSSSGQVVYTKWFQGRATLFSKDIFTDFLTLFKTPHAKNKELPRYAFRVLNLLEANSPLSTKRLKKESDLKGRDNERDYTQALKELWTRLFVVGYGEVDDGAFPSLAIGASQLLFEPEWKAAAERSREDAWKRIRAKLDTNSPFVQYLQKNIVPR